jgi:hypothetical protein
MTKKYLAFALAILPTLISCQTTRFSEQKWTTPRAPSTAEEAARSSSPGPIDDCLNFNVLYARDEGLTAECTLNYTHYYSEKLTPISKPNLRIGTFNLFHLGDNQSSLKNFKVVAQIMNQWDIVGSQELMPLPGPQADSNFVIFKLLSQTGHENEFVQKNLAVERPGYLNLLTALRELDPSWALILQSEAEGEGGSGEMAGFYYRQSVVQLREWDYCPIEKAADLKSQRPARNYGCLVQVPDQQRRLISRRAFAAYFQAGRLDFVGLTAHVRFRAADKLEDLKAQSQELCQNHANPQKCRPTKDSVGRYYEVKAIADQVDEIQKQANDRDVIYMGDFNLEYFTTTEPYWNAALKSAEGFKVFQHSPSTLGVKKNALVSNYDHFIFNPMLTTSCSPKSVRPYNFTLQSKTPTALQKVIAAAADPAQVQLQIQSRMNDVYKLAKAKISRDKTFVTKLDPKEIAEYQDRFKGAVARMRTNFTAATLELISDHVPAEMECSIQ